MVAAVIDDTGLEFEMLSAILLCRRQFAFPPVSLFMVSPSPDGMRQSDYNEVENKGYWNLTLGLNMNIDTTKYVGVYLNKTMAREADGELDVDDVNGYGFGVKFGIDF